MTSTAVALNKTLQLLIYAIVAQKHFRRGTIWFCVLLCVCVLVFWIRAFFI